MIHFPSTTFCHTSTTVDGNMSFRFGTQAEVTTNREAFLQTHKILPTQTVCMQCDHGEQIVIVTRENLVSVSNECASLPAEVLVTQEKNVALMLLTADCLPVSFFDPVTKTIALGHFSRQTIAQMLPQKTISFLQEHFKIHSKHIIVHIGPHIHATSYQFPLPLLTKAPALAPFITDTNGYASIDLVSALNYQLIEAGVALRNVAISPIDTATSPQHFSHFRSVSEDAPQGRLATVCMMTN